MKEVIINQLKKQYQLKGKDIGKYSTVKAKAMNFNIGSYEVGEIGCVSTIEMKAMLGLMKMETIVFTPLTKDAPLFSFDYINALGNETLLLELYDVDINEGFNIDQLTEIKSQYSDIKDHDLGQHWYDPIKMVCSVAKKAKKVTARYEQLVDKYFEKYLELVQQANNCTKEDKQLKVADYTNGLLTNGGPSTDQFIKMIGKEETENLFTKYIFFSKD